MFKDGHKGALATLRTKMNHRASKTQNILLMLLLAPYPDISTLILSLTLRLLFKKFFKGKKCLLTGPASSGKTTFLKYLSKDTIPEGPSGAPQTYQISHGLFTKVTDFSGDKTWLKAKFDEYIKDHNYILFFFDVYEYIKDDEYRKDSNARIDMIHRDSTSSQKVLMVGTHVDKVSGNYRVEVEKHFAGKSYQKVLDRIVYVDTTKKECVKTILKGLE